MLTSSKNTLVDIPGIIFDQMSGYRVAPVNVTQKIKSQSVVSRYHLINELVNILKSEDVTAPRSLIPTGAGSW